MTFIKLVNWQKIKLNLCLLCTFFVIPSTILEVYAQNLTELDELHFTADIDNIMPGAGGDIYSNDDAIIAFNLNSMTASSNNDLGVLDQAGIDGFHRADHCGETLYSVDTTTMVSGVAMRPADVFTSAGIKILDAAVAGISAGINVDAVSRDPITCDLVISIDTAATLGIFFFRQDDLIRWINGLGFHLYHSTGFNTNIDGLHIFKPSRMLISVDVGSMLSDIDVFDEDILEINSCASNAFQILAQETALLDTSWQGADLNAIWAQKTLMSDLIFSDGFDECQSIPS